MEYNEEIIDNIIKASTRLVPKVNKLSRAFQDISRVMIINTKIMKLKTTNKGDKS